MHNLWQGVKHWVDCQGKLLLPPSSRRPKLQEAPSETLGKHIPPLYLTGCNSPSLIKFSFQWLAPEVKVPLWPPHCPVPTETNI